MLEEVEHGGYRWVGGREYSKLIFLQALLCYAGKEVYKFLRGGKKNNKKTSATNEININPRRRQKLQLYFIQECTAHRSGNNSLPAVPPSALRIFFLIFI